MPQGLKNFNKSARDLLQCIQGVDGNNYPEVLASCWPLVNFEKLFHVPVAYLNILFTV